MHLKPICTLGKDWAALVGLGNISVAAPAAAPSEAPAEAGEISFTDAAGGSVVLRQLGAGAVRYERRECLPDASVAESSGGIPQTAGGTLRLTDRVALHLQPPRLGRTLELTPTSMSARDVSWQHELPQLGAGRHTVTLPLAHFSGSIHGQPVPGADLDTAALSSIGLNSSIFDMQGQAIPGREGGPFSFTLHALEWV